MYRIHIKQFFHNYGTTVDPVTGSDKTVWYECNYGYETDLFESLKDALKYIEENYGEVVLVSDHGRDRVYMHSKDCVMEENECEPRQFILEYVSMASLCVRSD